MDELWHLRRRLLRILVQYGTRRMMAEWQKLMETATPVAIRPMSPKEWDEQAKRNRQRRLKRTLRVVKGGKD